MPIYVYERPDGSRFEIRQGFNDSSLTEDPETGVPVRRVLQPAPIIFKGSGWYKTDNRATTAPKAEASKSETATTTTETTSEKAEKPTETTAKTTTEAAPTKPSAEAKKSADKIAAAAS